MSLLWRWFSTRTPPNEDDFFPLNRLDFNTWVELVKWLPIHCITRLYRTGDGLLMEQLSKPGLVRELHVETRLDRRRAKRLKRFYASSIDLADVERVSLHNTSWFSDYQAYICMSTMRFVTAFTNLKHLTLNYIYMTFNAYVPSLPQSLVSLTFINCILSERLYVVFSLLPDGLERLTIARCQWVVSDDALIELPPNLTSLVINNVARGLRSITNASIPHLPRSLTCLALNAQHTITDDAICHLPPSLRFLDLGDDDNFTDETLRQLPSTLTHLAFPMPRSGMLFSDGGIASLPRSLTLLSLPYNKRVTSSCFASLPRSLTYLDFGGATDVHDGDIACLPRNIIYLNLMSAHLLTGQALQHLPPRLQLVDLTAASANIEPHHVANLPSSLQVITRT